jgi:hypothetical protein
VVAGHRRGGGWRLRAHGGAACQQGAQKCDGWPGGGPEWLVTGGNPVAARSSAGFNIPCHRWVTLFALGGGRMRGSAPQLAALGHSPSATAPGATMSIVQRGETSMAMVCMRWGMKISAHGAGWIRMTVGAQCCRLASMERRAAASACSRMARAHHSNSLGVCTGTRCYGKLARWVWLVQYRVALQLWFGPKRFFSK